MSLAQQITTKIEAALKKRRPLQAFDAVRLFDGLGDGVQGLLVDRFGTVAVIRIHADSEASRIIEPHDLVPLLAGTAGIKSVIAWSHSGDAAETTKSGAVSILGDTAQEFIIKEGILSFIVRPFSTPSAGFFIDMREVRKRLSETSRGKRVLNTFCFTGSLGIAALVGGATEVVQVDISKSVLSWAKENLELNKAAATGEMRFIPEDTGTFLDREIRRVKRGRARYSTIIIDPPVFGSSKGKRFVQSEELGRLAHQAVQLLDTGGEIILTSNQRDLSASSIERIVREAASENQRSVSKCEVLAPPSGDFSSSGEGSHAMRGVVVQVK